MPTAAALHDTVVYWTMAHLRGGTTATRERLVDDAMARFTTEHQALSVRIAIVSGVHDAWNYWAWVQRVGGDVQTRGTR